jgi:hypothetical protein
MKWALLVTVFCVVVAAAARPVLLRQPLLRLWHRNHAESSEHVHDMPVFSCGHHGEYPEGGASVW